MRSVARMSSGKAHIGPNAASASASSVRGARASVAQAPRDTPALSCRGLTFRYAEGETPVFSDISLSVQPGETLLVMGPSGCGKSTLAYCLAGLYPDYAGVLEGSVEVEGRPIDRMGPQERSRAVSILFQNPDNQFCMDTVPHEVLFALENVDCPGDLDARAHELLELAGLDGYAHSPIHTLSGGTKQKLALVTALATGARTLVLDEPFANLSSASRNSMIQILLILQEQGKSMVVNSQMFPETRDFFTDVALVEDGRVVVEGETEEIFETALKKSPVRMHVLAGIEEALAVLKENALVDRVTVDEQDVIFRFNGGQREEAELLTDLVASGAFIQNYMRDRINIEEVFRR